MKESKKKRPKALSEDEAYRIALNDHPEYKRMIDEGNLPDEIVDEEGNAMSPRAHLAMHQIVERQLASNKPRGVVDIERRLLALGVSRHDVRHIIATAMSDEMWHVMKGHRPFDERRYLNELQRLVEEYR